MNFLLVPIFIDAEKEPVLVRWGDEQDPPRGMQAWNLAEEIGNASRYIYAPVLPYFRPEVIGLRV